MLQTITKIIKWIALPALVIMSLLSGSNFEFLLDFAICLGSVVFVQRAARLKEYYWAAGFVAVAIVFSPFLLLVKIFLLMTLGCIATACALVAAFQPQPASAV